MPAPLVGQGTINRLRATMTFPSFPALNISAAYLAKDAISIVPQGDVTHIIPTLTGVVTSPEPYQIVEVTAHILRTNALGDLFKKQIELLATLGNSVIHSDTTAFSDYNLSNVAIKSVDSIDMNGENAGWKIHFQGAYQINSSLYSA